MKNTEFEGNLSILFLPNEKIIFSFNHNEEIFNKNAFTRKCQRRPDGEQLIVPKDDGTRLIVSVLQSREFRIGFQKLTDIEVTKINNKIHAGKRYFDKEAARKMKELLVKDLLTIDSDSFIT